MFKEELCFFGFIIAVVLILQGFAVIEHEDKIKILIDQNYSQQQDISELKTKWKMFTTK